MHPENRRSNSSRTQLACRMLAVLVLAALFGSGASLASAASPAAGLTIHSVAFQGPFTVGQAANYQVTATNSGAETSEGPIVVKDLLPAGFSVAEPIKFFLLPTVPVVLPVQGGISRKPQSEDCVQEGEPATGVTVVCTYPANLAPDQALEIELSLTAEATAQDGAINTASVTGASAPEPVLSQEPLHVGSLTPTFGPIDLVSSLTGTDGRPDSQAGDHPYEFTTRFDLKSVERANPIGSEIVLMTLHEVKDVVVDLPIGLIGDAQATPKCPFSQLASVVHCPPNTRVGQIHTEPGGNTQAYTTIFNVVPEHGVAAEFGFSDGLDTTHVIYATVRPTPEGYIVRATTREVPQVALTNAVVTFFGNPVLKDQTGSTQTAFFTNPSDCSGKPRITTAYLDSWQQPGAFANNGTPSGEAGLTGENWLSVTSGAQESPPVTGCNLLRFKPSSFTVKPDTTTADSPTGLNFDLKIPQSETPGTLATPPLRNATVTLPAGLTVDPSAGNGLQACSVAQIGWKGVVSSSNRGLTNFTADPPACPDASKIGSVEVTSPLIEGTLQGSVYLARQQENPFGSLLAGYIVIDDPTTGIIVKVPGELKTDPSTGQITGVFDQNPQLPFSELKLRFFGGARGDLATPEGCGTYTTTSDFEPWSAPESGPDATPSDSFQIDNGCVSGFAPAFSAGTVSPQGGAFSPFLLSLSKEDSEQGMGGLTVTLPPGLVGKIAGVGQCSEAQVAAAQARSGLGQGAQELASPSCPESSLLGTVTTASGPGPQPFSVTGKAYLTGPYKNAPYGMAVVVPALAGPFDLGVVVIRQALYISPTDSHVTDVSDPFPTIRDGIPLRIKRVDVNINRPGFTLNPTSCETKAITGIATSTTGAQAALSSHFQASGCKGLAFHPDFTASTQANGTRKGQGASLDVKIGYPQPYTSYANILKVDTSLPLALSSRLTTLQKACTETQFAVNPAGCPPASAVGIATATTPLLPDPLSGPAYLVSHGGRAFPDLDIILQGNNVTIDLTGNTDIKNGITYSKFESAPDAPVSSFELNLPEKENSILAAVKNLCAPTKSVTVKKKVTRRVHGHAKRVTKRITTNVPEALIMPTSMTAQNGAVITQNINVAVTGCGKTKKAKAKKKPAAKKKAKR